MRNAINAIVVAHEMIVRYGRDAAAMMDERRLAHFQSGDQEAAAFWSQVAQAVRELQSAPNQTHAPARPEFFRPAFEATPHPYLLLAPNLRIVGANDAYLSVTMTRRSDLLGCDMFEAFPDNPDNPEADGVRNLGASLNRVLDHGTTDRMMIQRYDIRQPDGVFEERWWQPVNIPVFNDEGRLAWILHHVEDVTATAARPG